MLSLLLDADALLTEASHTYKGSEEASTITLFSAETDFKQNSCFASSFKLKSIFKLNIS